MKRSLNIKSIVIGLFIFLSMNGGVLYARSSSDIAKDIENQKKTLDQNRKDLQKAKTNLDYYNTALKDAGTGIPALEAEIKQVEAEIDFNVKKLEVLNENRVLKELEKAKREVEREYSLKSNYMEWRTKDTDINKFIEQDFDFKKSVEYSNLILNKQNLNILGITYDLNDLKKDIEESEKVKSDLETANNDLKKKKEDLERQIASYKYQIFANSNQINNLEVSVKTIQTSLTSLTEEQRQAILREEEILRRNQGTLGNSECQAEGGAAPGSVFLCGNGRDLAMGHGVGMSQYGARGAALAGLNAAQILQFYYQGAQVTSGAVGSNISVKYCPNNPALDAFQDGCNGGEQPVTESVSFDTYLAGLGEMPESWPIEARKAQMIAARTYAANYVRNGAAICLTTYCQVSYFKNGDTSELAVAQATSGQVLTYGGSFIEALYSADNNQGNGTADYDTRFQNTDGSASANRPYLKSVNDNVYAQNSRLYWNYYCGGSPCGLWKWKTKNYSFSDIDTLLDHAGQSGLKNAIGGVASISFERDPSLRVKKVWLNGKNGQQRSLGGWWFKYYWNIWVESRGTYDYIYSQTYYLNVN